MSGAGKIKLALDIGLRISKDTSSFILKTYHSVCCVNSGSRCFYLFKL